MVPTSVKDTVAVGGIGKTEVRSRVNGRSQVKWRWWWHILSCECSASGIYRIWEVPGR